MFAKTTFSLFMCSVLVLCESAFVDNLKKCSISDAKCQKATLQSVIRGIGKTGIPEYGIPPTDPYDITNLSVSILNMVNITMIDGVAKGIKDCVVNKFDTRVEEEKSTMEMTCDLTVKGKYKVYGSSPLIKNLLGGNTVHGEGSAKVVIDKMRMKFDYHLNIVERNGDTYIYANPKDVKYSYSVGKVTFDANNIYLGDTEASSDVVKLLNDNWKFVIQTFGKPVIDKAMDIIYEQSHKFFNVVPTKHYLTDDLTPYIKT